MHRHLTTVTGAMRTAATFAVLVSAAGCLDMASYQSDPDFPRKEHSLLPPAPSPFDTTQPEWALTSGAITGRGLQQPVSFSHYRHATEMNMQCEYCHSNARRTIHGGVPETRVCAGCHWAVKKDSPRIQMLLAAGGEGCDYTVMGPNDKCGPTPWRKNHDLPDFVHFNHSRHVQGGVQCTECHGQMAEQGKYKVAKVMSLEEAQAENKSFEPVIRETTMQMGWCLDCHATHPSVDTNYGDLANARRAELKDCWTCHK